MVISMDRKKINVRVDDYSALLASANSLLDTDCTQFRITKPTLQTRSVNQGIYFTRVEWEHAWLEEVLQ